MTEHHDRDTVVVTEGGSSMGTILGVALIIVLLIGVWYFTLGPGGGSSTPADTDGDNQVVPSLEVPAPS
jgi:hypothetical protein